MCGIVGSFSASSPEDIAARARAALRALAHRGPDDEGLELLDIANGVLALGHRRLSIIDLTSAGHQPMRSADGRYVMIFNGEIYNYRELRDELRSLGHEFRSDSDSEVLLASWIHWGADCLPKLVGMFAFVLLDRSARTLTLARDPFGIKPLFYRFERGAIHFSSELPAMAKLGASAPRQNVRSVYDYLVHGRYDDEAETFLEGVCRLPPSHLLVVDLADVVDHASGAAARPEPAPVRWWWPSIAERTDLSFNQAAEQLREMFLASVRLHLRSDVPVGAALSGGIDSSAVVCAMRHLEPDMPIHTFSFAAADPALNEEKWIDLVNETVGAIPHKVRLRSDCFAKDIFDVVAAQGEPFGTTSIYAQYEVFREASACGIKVILNGQGADETVGGYEGYPSFILRTLVEQGRWGQALSFARTWRKRFGHGPRAMLRTLGSTLLRDELKKGLTASLSERRLADCLLAKSGPCERTATSKKASTPDGYRRRLSQTLRDELVISRLPRLLRYDDRNSMRWSIESRVPFLTIPLAEFLLSLPEDYLVSPSAETKRLFRHAMRGIVPDAVLDRSDKIGFDVPERALVAGAWPSIRARIEAGNGACVLDRQKAIDRIDAIFEASSGYDQTAWRMINLMVWQDQLVWSSSPAIDHAPPRPARAAASR